MGELRPPGPLQAHALQQVLIEMIPTPGQGNVEGGRIIRTLLTEFLRGFSLRTLIFLLDMVVPQLDAYHSGRQLQHLQPWVSVELAQQQSRGQPGVRLNATYQYEAYAGFHAIQLLQTELQSCCLATQWPSLNSHRGTYVRRVSREHGIQRYGWASTVWVSATARWSATMRHIPSS